MAIFNLRGDPITSEEIPIPRGQPAEDIFENIVNTMQKQMARFKKIDGIGIAVPGPFLESDERVILITESPEWQGFQLIPELRTRFPSLPLFSIHDAKAAALTEWRNKLPRNGAKVLLYVSAGQGIGSALVIDGEVYRGAVGLAGEMGHMSIQADGGLCKCGNIGCLELYASRISLLRAVREKETPRLKSDATFSDVVHAYLDSDPVAISEVHRIASYLAQGITNCVNFTNPDLIVIGDEYALFGDRFLDEIKSQIEKRLLPSVFSSVDVKLSEVTQDTVLAGTFLDVFSQTYLGVAREIYHTLPTESV
jgi:predicted NBD/HSP70 family sugar kinase